MNNYDYVVIGGGPSGLTFAQYMIKAKKSVLIVEKESEIGGCHRVKRIKYGGESLFSEHGPRVYSNVFLTFINLLKDMGVDFNELFTEYNFSFTTIGGVSFRKLLNNEKWVFIKEYLKLIVNSSHGKDISVGKFMDDNDFSVESKEYIDNVCRLTDGATSETYTLFQFLSLVNQQSFYSLYQPKLPNDEGLFRLWGHYLKSSKYIDIKLDTRIHSINIKDNVINGISLLGKDGIIKVSAKKYIFAIPPIEIARLMVNEYIGENIFGDGFIEFASKTKYIDYKSIIFHWDDSVELPKVWGFPKNDWGIAFVVLTDYMKFKENASKTVISVIITKTESKSQVSGKTMRESFDKEIIVEVFRQLRESFPTLSDDYVSFIYDNVESAYISNIYNKKVNYKSKVIDNLYTIGTHNGNSYYNFTSIETAVSNSLGLCHLLEPKYKELLPIIQLTELSFVIKVVLIVVILIIYFRTNK